MTQAKDTKIQELTEERVREIIKEEIIKAFSETKQRRIELEKQIEDAFYGVNPE